MKPSSRVKDLTGQRFSSLVVISFYEIKNKRAVWKCKCSCGRYKLISSTALVQGGTKTCGCSHSQANTIHGCSGLRSNNIWFQMMKRCYNADVFEYKNYGDRGITVCDRWHEFKNFDVDMGQPPTKKHSLDRIDNNKGYSLDNCRWATDKEQARNRRGNFVIEFKGEKKCLSEWCEVLSLPYKRTWKRLRVKCWSVDRAFSPD